MRRSLLIVLGGFGSIPLSGQEVAPALLSPYFWELNNPAHFGYYGSSSAAALSRFGSNLPNTMTFNQALSFTYSPTADIGVGVFWNGTFFEPSKSPLKTYSQSANSFFLGASKEFKITNSHSLRFGLSFGLMQLAVPDSSSSSPQGSLGLIYTAGNFLKITASAGGLFSSGSEIDETGFMPHYHYSGSVTAYIPTPYILLSPYVVYSFINSETYPSPHYIGAGVHFILNNMLSLGAGYREKGIALDASVAFLKKIRAHAGVTISLENSLKPPLSAEAGLRYTFGKKKQAIQGNRFALNEDYFIDEQKGTALSEYTEEDTALHKFTRISRIAKIPKNNKVNYSYQRPPTEYTVQEIQEMERKFQDSARNNEEYFFRELDAIRVLIPKAVKSIEWMMLKTYEGGPRIIVLGAYAERDNAVRVAAQFKRRTAIDIRVRRSTRGYYYVSYGYTTDPYVLASKIISLSKYVDAIKDVEWDLVWCK